MGIQLAPGFKTPMFFRAHKNPTMIALKDEVLGTVNLRVPDGVDFATQTISAETTNCGLNTAYYVGCIHGVLVTLGAIAVIGGVTFVTIKIVQYINLKKEGI